MIYFSKSFAAIAAPSGASTPGLIVSGSASTFSACLCNTVFLSRAEPLPNTRVTYDEMKCHIYSYLDSHFFMIV